VLASLACLVLLTATAGGREASLISYLCCGRSLMLWLPIELENGEGVEMELFIFVRWSFFLCDVLIGSVLLL
jgi:hypothetical protein